MTDPEQKPDTEATSQVVVISGMSGAGRTEAAKVLEDLGYYVIDNLPPSLVGTVVDLAARAGRKVERLAVVVDVRGQELFGEVVGAVETLRAAYADIRVLFLEANDEALVRRFEESRRPHPLADTDSDEGLVQGISRERTMLEELRGNADLIIDTTDLNVHELRDRLVEGFGETDSARMRVNLVSFGFKYGLPRDADIVMDVRFLPNPHWVEELRPLTGKDDDVRDYVLEQPATGPFLDRFHELLDIVIPGGVEEGKRYLTIAIGCTGGRHRSVAISETVAAHVRETTGLPVRVEHRDVGP